MVDTGDSLREESRDGGFCHPTDAVAISATACSTGVSGFGRWGSTSTTPIRGATDGTPGRNRGRKYRPTIGIPTPNGNASAANDSVYGFRRHFGFAYRTRGTHYCGGDWTNGYRRSSSNGEDSSGSRDSTRTSGLSARARCRCSNFRAVGSYLDGNGRSDEGTKRSGHL